MAYSAFSKILKAKEKLDEQNVPYGKRRSSMAKKGGKKKPKKGKMY